MSSYVRHFDLPCSAPQTPTMSSCWVTYFGSLQDLMFQCIASVLKLLSALIFVHFIFIKISFPLFFYGKLYRKLLLQRFLSTYSNIRKKNYNSSEVVVWISFFCLKLYCYQLNKQFWMFQEAELWKFSKDVLV